MQHPTQWTWNLFPRPSFKLVKITDLSWRWSLLALFIGSQNAYKTWGIMDVRISNFHHCFFPFFFLLLPLLLPPPLLLPFPALADGLSVEVPALWLLNTPACTAFCNHSKNSSSVMVSSILGAGIRPLLCPELGPLLVLCLEVTLVFTWKLGLWLLAGHLIPCTKFNIMNIQSQSLCERIYKHFALKVMPLVYFAIK